MLPQQPNLEKISKNCTNFSCIQKHKNFRLIAVTLLILKNSKKSIKKTYQFKTQCKGDISHTFETAKITVFDPVLCKTPGATLQNVLLY